MHPGRTPCERAAAGAEADQPRARLDHVADQYADGLLHARQLARITAKVRPQLTPAQARRRIVDRAPLLDGMIGVQDVQAAWNRLPLSLGRRASSTRC